MKNIFVLLKTRTMKPTLARRKKKNLINEKNRKHPKMYCKVLEWKGNDPKETLCPSKGEIPQEYLLVKTSSAAQSHLVTDNHVPPKRTLCIEGLFLSVLLLMGLSFGRLPSFYLSTGCKYLTIPLHREEKFCRTGKITCRSCGDRNSFSG